MRIYTRLGARTRILRLRTRVTVKFITIACGWEVDSLEKLTMSILSYFQKVPLVEPEKAEVQRHVGQSG